MICRSVRQTPHAETSITTWPAAGSGSATSSTASSRGRLSSAARTSASQAERRVLVGDDERA